MTQKPVFVEGLFTVRNIRTMGAAAIVETLIGAGIAAVLIWHQLQPAPAVPKAPIAVDPVPELPMPMPRSTPEPAQPQPRDLSPVPPVRTDIPTSTTQPVQPPSLPPVPGQRPQASADLAAGFSRAMLGAIDEQKVYPKISVLRGETGDAVVSFDYVDGVVSNLHLDKSSGSRALDMAALEAVQRAVLPPKPAELAGLQHFAFTLVFDLNN